MELLKCPKLDKRKPKTCQCGTEFLPYNTIQKFCSANCQFKFGKKINIKLKSLNPEKKRYAIPKVSEKRKALNPLYASVRIEVLVEANFKCFIDGCINVANTCEHTMGRKGFADQWARDNDIPLLIDKRYLKACCLHHNGELENNPELSKEYQLSKIHGGKKL